MNVVEINKIISHLSGMDVNDLRTLYDTIYLKLVRHNGYAVDYNPTSTALLGCHSNTLLLGSFEQSSSSLHQSICRQKKDATRRVIVGCAVVEILTGTRIKVDETVITSLLA